MKTIKGPYVGNRKDTTEALDFFARGLIKALFKTIGMSNLQEVYDMMHGFAQAAVQDDWDERVAGGV